MVSIEIDGQTVEVESGSMIIEAADHVGIKIPRFCYHKKLSIAANCRMCLVHVEKAPKPLPACATPVTNGMIVHTHNKEAVEVQKAVMEFLLINHPLDCPICDQGGECELQDVAMGYGKGVSRYDDGKRTVKDKNIGSLISTDMTRCILCTRCVRFGTEIAGMRELGVTGRGEHSEIGTYIERDLRSELSGNVIDLCPVGALTSKPFRFRARAWELEQTASVAAHDGVGSNIFVHHLRGKVMRVVPRENESINETWISDRDRFSYCGLDSDERITAPQIKRDGQWETVDWQTALHFAAEGLQRVLHTHGPEQLGVLLSASASVEEAYLLQKLLRDLGGENIDHRLQQTDFSYVHETYPSLEITLAEVEQQKNILLVGCHVRQEAPILGNRLHTAALKGASISSINPFDCDYHFPQKNTLIVKPFAMVEALGGVVKQLLSVETNQQWVELKRSLENIQPNTQQVAIADQLKLNPESKYILLGALALNHPQASLLHELVNALKQLTNAQVGYLYPGANVAGMWLAGALPHRAAAGVSVAKPGLTAAEMLNKLLRSYIIYGIEPELDSVAGVEALASIKSAEFVIALNSFAGNTKQYADVILPITPFTEMSGTFVNAQGDWQSFCGIVPALGEARPGWKVLRVLGNFLRLEGFNYKSSDEVRHELKATIKSTDTSAYVQPIKEKAFELPSRSNAAIERIAYWPVNRIDSLTRRSLPLQESGTSEYANVYLNEAMQQQLNIQPGSPVKVTQKGKTIVLPLTVSDKIPDGCVYIPAGFAETAVLSNVYEEISIEKV